MVALVINTDEETRVVEVITDITYNQAYDRAVLRMNKMESNKDDRLGANYDVVGYETLEEAFNSLIQDAINKKEKKWVT